MGTRMGKMKVDEGRKKERSVSGGDKYDTTHAQTDGGARVRKWSEKARVKQREGVRCGQDRVR